MMEVKSPDQSIQKVSFKAEAANGIANLPQFSKLKTAPAGNDELVKTSEKKEKVGIIQKVKNFIAACKKLGVSITEYTKGTATGVTKGAIYGGLTYLGFKVVETLRRQPLPKP